MLYLRNHEASRLQEFQNVLQFKSNLKNKFNLYRTLLSGLDGRGPWLKSFLFDVSPQSVCGIFRKCLSGSHHFDSIIRKYTLYKLSLFGYIKCVYLVHIPRHHYSKPSFWRYFISIEKQRNILPAKHLFQKKKKIINVRNKVHGVKYVFFPSKRWIFQFIANLFAMNYVEKIQS